MLIDTHCHLDLTHFDGDRHEVVQRAINNDVEAIIAVGTDIISSEKVLKLAENNPHIYAAVGVHPNEVAASYRGNETLKTLEQMADHPKVVAIGEIGIDLFRDFTSADDQKVSFREQISLAKSIGLPVIIHNRDADSEIMAILSSENIDGLTGVAHCFTGNIKRADLLLKMNFYISFTGNITFKKVQLDEVIKHVSLDRLILETDAPFMTPVPHRGKRNEPSYVRHTAEYIAEIKQISIEELGNITTANAKRLFQLD